MHSRCCWPPERLRAGVSSRSFTSVQSAACVRLRSTISDSRALVALPGQARPVDHVLPDGAGQRQGQGKHHAHPAAQPRDVDARRVDVLPVQEDAAGHLRAVHQVVQPVDQPHERGLAAPRGAEEHGDGPVGDIEGEPFSDCLPSYQ